MKPEKLILCGWGPYKEETIVDFHKLNNTGLFLITGQTGAGKTTIFDAIAYALYGVLSGEVREKTSVRSDFADVETKTYVELYMRHKKETYHISRNPEYLRPKKRKSGENAFTKEKENAVLTMPDGTIIAGNQEVTAKIEELLHMDAKQFRQISMIAQGEFSRMLFASSAEKNAIFRELFGTGIYAQMQLRLKNRSAALYQEYMLYKNKMEEDMRLPDLEDEDWKNLVESKTPDLGAVTEYLKETAQKGKEELEKSKKEADRIEEEILSLQKELEKIGQINQQFAELEQNTRTMEELEKRQPQMEALKRRIATVKHAQVLSLEEKVVLEKERTAEGLDKRLRILKRDLDSLEERKIELEQTLMIKDDILDAFALSEQMAENNKAITEWTQKAEKCKEDLSRARVAYEGAQETSIMDNRCYEEADIRYKRAVVGIAAKLVKEGEPCPVCGSIDHPKIAHMEEEIPDEKQLEQLKQRAEKSRQIERQLYERALLLTNEENNLQEKLHELILQKEQLQQKESTIPEGALDYIHSHTRAEFEQVQQKSLEIQAMLKEKQHALEETKIQHAEIITGITEAKTAFSQKQKACGFEKEEDYKQAVGYLKSLPEWEKESRVYEDSVMAAKKMQEYLQNILKGFEKREEAPCQEIIAKKQEQLRTCRKIMERMHVRQDQVKRALDGIALNRKKAEEIRKTYGIVKDLDDLANGNNARRLVFEQYVLSGYFEDILKAANKRLHHMTEGRYELLRAGEIRDGRKKDNLEIEVMDHYTGRKRSVRTLSGGETFKASLSMALGMSDCIQAQNGGMEVETLFIDEGFGALDEESLEQACETLQTLAGKNRMVGVISHVAGLQERIDHQIIVGKRNDGSYIRVI